MRCPRRNRQEFCAASHTRFVFDVHKLGLGSPTEGKIRLAARLHKVTEMGGLFTEMLKQIAGSLFLQSVKVIAAILLPSLTAVAMVSLMPLASETW